MEKISRMKWRPTSESFSRLPLRDDNAAWAPDFIHNLGIFETQDAETPKDDALGLLKLASEVEHAVLVQYLYGASSISSGNAASVQAKNKLTRIAVQEMLHLLSTQNLLIALGGPSALHLERDVLRARSDLNPMSFDLEPISRLTLAKYIITEMPAKIPDVTLNDRVAKLKDMVSQNGNVQAHRVGAIYAPLMWLFQSDDDPIGPLHLSTDLGFRPGWHLKPEDFIDPAIIVKHAATRDEWRATGATYVLDAIQSMDAGRQLLTKLSSQGEGWDGNQDSHFYEFIELLDLFDAGNLTFNELPNNPAGRVKPPFDSPTVAPITDSYTILWSDLFDIRYTMIVLDIAYSLSLPRDNPQRGKVIELCFDDGMVPVLGLLADKLTSLPLNDDRSKGFAAPTYGCIFQALPTDSDSLLALQRTALLREESTLTAIKSHGNFGTDQDGSELIAQFADQGGFHDRRKLVFHA
ncbi:ferritin-like domain-containing protein [Paraburkholderia sp. BL17N1]|uniref:ferritin-like domain-containing protein n=1 Tax=Paraburkholderia sp. BL17N1 TaxID=1938798 RepID=UPI000EB2C0C8|nr:ferritin-like domain-containing protein [Paraburkholderia sp. BL17N1]RKR43225.1 ferritin-like protein [Paraburkholderia sp. BL17N1]